MPNSAVLPSSLFTSCPHKQRGGEFTVREAQRPWEILRGVRESGMAVYWARETNAKKRGERETRANDVLASLHCAMGGRKMASRRRQIETYHRFETSFITHPKSLP